ncbi:MAG: hypothetical protein QOH55_1860 [Microbacteriaceae bacterium]|nr:hypothetical protein [Microbacteriaceae bacterium]
MRIDHIVADGLVESAIPDELAQLGRHVLDVVEGFAEHRDRLSEIGCLSLWPRTAGGVGIVGVDHAQFDPLDAGKNAVRNAIVQVAGDALAAFLVGDRKPLADRLDIRDGAGRKPAPHRVVQGARDNDRVDIRARFERLAPFERLEPFERLAPFERLEAKLLDHERKRHPEQDLGGHQALGGVIVLTRPQIPGAPQVGGRAVIDRDVVRLGGQPSPGLSERLPQDRNRIRLQNRIKLSAGHEATPTQREFAPEGIQHAHNRRFDRRGVCGLLVHSAQFLAEVERLASESHRSTHPCGIEIEDVVNRDAESFRNRFHDVIRRYGV